MVSMRPPGGSALAIQSVENPIAVPISRMRFGATAVTRTRSRRPDAGLTIGTPSARPVLSISSSTVPKGAWTPSRYWRSVSLMSMRRLPAGEMIQGAVPVPEPGRLGQRAEKVRAGFAHGRGQVFVTSEGGGDGRREGAARAMGTSSRDPGRAKLMDTLAVDQQIDDRVLVRVATFDHDRIRSKLHDGATGRHPVGLSPDRDPSQDLGFGNIGRHDGGQRQQPPPKTGDRILAKAGIF